MSNKPYLPYMEFGPVSTSNRNTPSDYCLEQKQNKDNQEWRLNPHGSGGMAFTPAISNAGTVPPSRIWRDQLSHNPIDTESWMFNIDKKLGQCEGERKKFCPQFKYLPMLSFFEHPKEVIMPEPLEVRWNERAFPVPQK